MNIDPTKPVRFSNDNGRVRIVGRPGTDFNVRYHDGAKWDVARFTRDGNAHSLHGSYRRQTPPRLENYEINWHRPLAFHDNLERGRLIYFPGTEQAYGVQASEEGKVYWFDPSGSPIEKDGRPKRHIMNVSTAAMDQADAARRVATKRAEQIEAEKNPLWGLF